MKNLMKTLLILAVLLPTIYSSSFAQKIEIMVVGSSHENKPGEEDYAAVVRRLQQFNPEMVFGEYLSATDYNKLDSGGWGYKTLQKRREYIERHFPEKVKSIDKKIAEANKSLMKFPYYHKLRMDLASYYIKTDDRANSDYQIYVLENEMKKSFGPEEARTYKQLFGNADTLKKLGFERRTSEYANIYFPLVYALKLDKMYPMDCQKYDVPWSKAWRKAAAAIEELEKKAAQDPASEEAKTLAAIEKYSSLTEDDKKQMSKSPYTNMATSRYADLNDAWNFYGGTHFYGYAGFPTEHVKGMFEQWALRNETMSTNVLRQVKEKKVKRVVVGVGAAHRRAMEEFLAKDPDVKIVSYNDLP